MEHSGDPAGSRPARAGATTRPATNATTGLLLPATGPGLSGPPRSFEAGRRVGGYHLVEPLGAGGQAVVWRAVRLGSPPREVALKLIAISGSARDGRGLARLRREARRVARIDCEAILPVTEFGTAEGVAYLAMPLVEGGTLAEALEQRRGGVPAVALWLARVPAPLYARAVAWVGLRVARALQAAHDVRVVHCDVKPANILLDRRRPGRVYLADFGMGRDLEAVPPGRPPRLEGTPAYMAPERLLGGSVEAPLCDIYSLGVTLFEAVSAALPVGVPASPGRPAVWLPPELEAIIRSAMAGDPARRYQRASALAEDLERFLRGRRVGAARRTA